MKPTTEFFSRVKGNYEYEVMFIVEYHFVDDRADDRPFGGYQEKSRTILEIIKTIEGEDSEFTEEEKEWLEKEMERVLI